MLQYMSYLDDMTISRRPYKAMAAIGAQDITYKVVALTDLDDYIVNVPLRGYILALDDFNVWQVTPMCWHMPSTAHACTKAVPCHCFFGAFPCRGTQLACWATSEIPGCSKGGSSCMSCIMPSMCRKCLWAFCCWSENCIELLGNSEAHNLQA